MREVLAKRFLESEVASVMLDTNQPLRLREHLMTCQSTNAETIYSELALGVARARRAADERNLDPDEVCTWMTTSMMAAVRPATADHCLLGVGMFHGHQVRFLKGPDMIAFSAHPKLV